ncbi:glycoside hydrolase family 3 N-terminal domain-containing protein [Christiangramia sabulilitoris]|uniref:beta-N-acetylhexosaminidase n=1 Tax=Christiangramia sabulilitoris TaxID=2583991 RepID=A0A550I828_9FLAO|nr:glycoside hydrolase family 3 N-terminal domain-containing protein [Christiangramia sabulilitoris]TRO67134.1 serine hydrolase [Christiangramia sabulilitoris]
MQIPRSTLKFFLLFLVFTLSSFGQTNKVSKPDFLKYEYNTWVDSVMQTLTNREKIAQLFMVPAYSNKGGQHLEELLSLVQKEKIGGIVFMQGNPEKQVKMMNQLQKASQIPLLGATDAEWGLGMRLKQTISFPYQMALGAVQNEDLIYKMGEEIARQLQRAGLHMNFAPVVDVNNNPNNPVINYRSFGEDKYNVVTKSLAYIQGMQDHNLLVTAKHFPGHGDTDTDSHLALPRINHDIKRLDSIEIYPFKKVIDAGVSGIMVAHLDIPALDSTQTPSTLSKPIVTNLLKNQLGFKGLVVSDAMNMKGVTKGNEPGIVDKDAILAGNDLIEFSEDISKAIAETEKALKQGILTEEDLNKRLRKILAAKKWVGLDNYVSISPDGIYDDLNTNNALLLNRKLTGASLTVLKNKKNLLPLKRLDTLKIASISIGEERQTKFQKTLGLYTRVKHFQLDREAGKREVLKLQQELGNYNLVIIGLHDFSIRPQNVLKLSEEVKEFVAKFSKSGNTIFAIFKNPYVLDKLENIEQAAGLIVAYQDSPVSQELTAQLIFGGIGASGRLPVSIGKKFQLGSGLDLDGGIRLGYTLPEDVGMDSFVLNSKIDSLMQEAMDARAIPGGEVLVARKGMVVFYKAYGFQNYTDTLRVKKDDLYDLASITKISSTLPVLMQLVDEGKFDLEAGINEYLPYFENSNKADIPFRDILAHQARFKPWIPYWKNTLRNNGSFKWNTFKQDSSRRFPIKINDQLWLHRNYKKKIFKAIKKSPLEKEAAYKYSGLAFYLTPEIIERITGESFRKVLDERIFDKVGASTLTYNPVKKFPLSRIIPTENDFLFRREAIHGTVHDEGAIMMGGVSGNAGLFSNANDLAKLMQMYLNMGEYGGQRFIQTKTLKDFSTTQFAENNNRRGLGFDKPYLKYAGEDSNTSKSASKSSFGHTGFTGTMAWADPEKDLVYIFLSNRVIPNRENTRLYKLNTKTKIQQAIYDAILD